MKYLKALGLIVIGFILMKLTNGLAYDILMANSQGISKWRAALVAGISIIPMIFFAYRANLCIDYKKKNKSLSKKKINKFLSKSHQTTIGSLVVVLIFGGLIYSTAKQKQISPALLGCEPRSFISPDNSKYVGESTGGMAHGSGTETYSNGSKYVGEWNASWYHGNGTFTFHAESGFSGEYVGEWKCGRMHGKGKATHIDGREFDGEWKDGEFLGDK